MKKIEAKRTTFLKRAFFQGLFLMAVLMMVPPQVWASPAKSKMPEMTPGPRMIRAVEALANDLLGAEEALILTPEQIKAVQKTVIDLKIDMWRKEAVLLGMFKKISLKRRHGLLSRGDYQATNQLTGGIETDEMGRMIKAVSALQEILSPEQIAVFKTLRKPTLHLKHPEGFNTRIGLLALGRINRAYGRHREKLGLSDAQKDALRVLLGAARREVIEVGTQIEISRMEAYDLLKEPIIEPRVVQKAMEQTAQLEGLFFPKLSEYSKAFEAILTPEQMSMLKGLGKKNPHVRPRHAGGDRPSYGRPSHVKKKMGSLLDQAHRLRLSQSEIEALVALEISAMEQLESNEVELKIDRVILEELVASEAGKQAIETQIDRIANRVAEIEKIRLSNYAAGMKTIKKRQKVTFHRPETEERRH